MNSSKANVDLLYEEHNLREVYPDLYISDVTVHKNVAVLKSLGITTVLNLLSMEEDSDVSQVYRTEGMDFMHLPMYDIQSFCLGSVVDQGTDYIQRTLRRKKKILVHCMAGTSRSPAMIIAYFITKLGMTFDQARRCIGSDCAINEGFLKQLSRLEQRRSFYSTLASCCFYSRRR